VIAKLTAKEGKRDELVRRMGGLLDVVNEEPGTLVYSIHTSTAEPNVIYFFELYTDQSALTAHASSDGLKAAGAGMGDLLGAAPELYTCEMVTAKGLPG
jgi:quinol monooxygenase YgiN